MLVEVDHQPIEKHSNPTAEDVNYSAHDVTGKVELIHSPEKEDGELGELQGATESDLSARSSIPPEDTGKQCVNGLQSNQKTLFYEHKEGCACVDFKKIKK